MCIRSDSLSIIRRFSTAGCSCIALFAIIRYWPLQLIISKLVENVLVRFELPIEAWRIGGISGFPSKGVCQGQAYPWVCNLISTLVSSMEVHEEHSPFDLDISSPPPRLQMASGRTECMIGERDSKSSHHHFRSEDNELDQLVNNINHFKEPKDGPKLEGLSTHQWISMVEEEAAEISLILERLSPQTSK